MLHPLDLVDEKLDVRGDVTEFGTCPELLEVVVKRMRSIERSDFGAWLRS